MGRAFKWIGIALLCLVVSGLLLYAVSRILPIPEDQAQALTLLDAERPLRGKNGIAALWVVTHDVPAAQAEQLLARDLVRFSAGPRMAGSGLDSFLPTIDRAPRLDEALKDAPMCTLREGSCLAKVRASLAIYEESIVQRRAISARVAALDQYDYFRNPFPPRLDMPIPSYRGLTLDSSMHAYSFVKGEVAAALSGVCRDASIARKLLASGDNLIGAMVGASMMQGSGQLYVEMLAELPADHPLPPECERVFLADGAMTDAICPTMLGEGRFLVGGLRTISTSDFDASWLLLDMEKMAGREAPRFTWYCGDAANALIADDRPLRNTTPSPTIWSLRCVANAYGCVLADVQPPAQEQYGLRLQDAEMRQKLVGTWLWLRGRPADTRALAERLAARPPGLKSTGREIVVSDDGKFLVASGYAADYEQVRLALPVPDWMADKSP